MGWFRRREAPAEEPPEEVADREHSWYAVPPGGGEKANLTPEHVEHLMLHAMSSPDRPTWPDWHQLS